MQDKTAEKILRAAFELFTQAGYKDTTTRDIARRAGVPLGSIPYHFKTKEKLYCLVFENMVEKVLDHLGPILHSVEAIANQEGESEEVYFRAVEVLLDQFLSGIYCEENYPMISSFIRELLNPGPGYEILYHKLFQRVQGILSLLVSRITKMEADAPEIILLVQSIMGQLISFRLHGETVRRRLGWKKLGNDEHKIIRDHILETTRTLIKNRV